MYKSCRPLGCNITGRLWDSLDSAFETYANFLFTVSRKSQSKDDPLQNGVENVITAKLTDAPASSNAVATSNSRAGASQRDAAVTPLPTGEHVFALTVFSDLIGVDISTIDADETPAIDAQSNSEIAVLMKTLALVCAGCNHEQEANASEGNCACARRNQLLRGYFDTLSQSDDSSLKLQLIRCFERSYDACAVIQRALIDQRLSELAATHGSRRTVTRTRAHDVGAPGVADVIDLTRVDGDVTESVSRASSNAKQTADDASADDADSVDATRHSPRAENVASCATASRVDAPTASSHIDNSPTEKQSASAMEERAPISQDAIVAEDAQHCEASAVTNDPPPQPTVVDNDSTECAVDAASMDTGACRSADDAVLEAGDAETDAEGAVPKAGDAASAAGDASPESDDDAPKACDDAPDTDETVSAAESDTEDAAPKADGADPKGYDAAPETDDVTKAGDSEPKADDTAPKADDAAPETDNVTKAGTSEPKADAAAPKADDAAPKADDAERNEEPDKMSSISSEAIIRALVNDLIKLLPIGTADVTFNIAISDVDGTDVTTTAGNNDDVMTMDTSNELSVDDDVMPAHDEVASDDDASEANTDDDQMDDDVTTISADEQTDRDDNGDNKADDVSSTLALLEKITTARRSDATAKQSREHNRRRAFGGNSVCVRFNEPSAGVTEASSGGDSGGGTSRSDVAEFEFLHTLFHGHRRQFCGDCQPRRQLNTQYSRALVYTRPDALIKTLTSDSTQFTCPFSSCDHLLFSYMALVRHLIFEHEDYRFGWSGSTEPCHITWCHGVYTCRDCRLNTKSVVVVIEHLRHHISDHVQPYHVLGRAGDDKGDVVVMCDVNTVHGVIKRFKQKVGTCTSRCACMYLKSLKHDSFIG